MKTLLEHINEADSKTRGMFDIKPDFPARIGDKLVIVTAILERTAVVHPLDHPENKFLAQLGVVRTLKAHIEWVPKSRNDQRIFHSRHRGLVVLDRIKGRFAKPTKKVAA